LIWPETQLPGALVWLLAPPSRESEGTHDSEEAADREGWLAGTVDGVFVRSAGRWETLPGWSELLRPAIATVGIALGSEVFAVGTQNQGVYIASRSGAVLRQFHQENALPDNDVHALWQAPDGNLWIGTAQGRARILPTENLSQLSGTSARALTVKRSLAQVGDALYVAECSGRFPGLLRVTRRN
jgi:ligand-binding sensor domain-containing protein